MAYQKRNFVKEQLLTAEDLNKMDEQIAKNEEEAAGAKTAAENAQSTAGEAKTAAENAQSTAGEAMTAANEAKDIAEEAKTEMENALISREILTSSDNLDEIDIPGMYYWRDGDIPTGSPVPVGSLMIVHRSGSFNIIKQTVVPGLSSYKQKTRVKYYSTWQEWDEAIDANSVMRFQKTLTAEDDINALRQTGIYDYYVSGIPQNAPFGENTTAVLIYVMASDAGYPTIQVAFGDHDMKYRSNHTASDALWGEWSNSGCDINVVNETGTSVKDVMSQAAVTAAIAELARSTTEKINERIEKDNEIIQSISSVGQIASEAKTNASDAMSAAEAANNNASSALSQSSDALEAVANAFVDRGELSSEDNIDNVQESGLYRWYDNNTPAGNPVTGGAMMVVFRSGTQNLITQTVTSLYPSEKTKKRTMYPSGWSEWSESLEDDSNVMTYRRTLTASDNMNTIEQIGVYFYTEDDAPANAPFDTGGVSVMVYGSAESSGIVTQIAAKRFENATYIKIRVGGGSDAWSSWLAINESSGYFAYRERLQSDDDVNLIVTPGIYYLGISEGNVPANSPFQPGETTSPVLFVYGSDGSGNAGNEIVQLATGFGGKSAQMKFRTGGLTETNWTPWMNVLTGEIVQETGESTTAVMSQKAVKDALKILEDDIPKAVEIVQETGESTTAVMSQKAVTEALEEITGGSGGSGVRNALKMTLTNGIFMTDDTDAIKPTAIGGMKVRTTPGTMFINGYGKKVAQSTRTYIVSDTDRVEVNLYRLDESTGEITNYWRDVIDYGDVLVSIEDSAELPIREGTIYDILICKVTIPAGATAITADMVEDLRGIEAYCGSVKSKFVNMNPTKPLIFTYEDGTTETVEVLVK